MRKYIFRAWDDRNKRMIYDFDSPYIGLLNFITGLNEDGELFCGNEGDWQDKELMQYTGLKDKQGKMIFEGDILRKTYGSSKRMASISFFNGGYIFDDGYDTDLGSMDLSLIEVIGNVHENPELLK